MLAAFARAMKDAFAPEQRRALILSMGLAVLLLAILWAGATKALIARAHVGGIGWLGSVVDVLGGGRAVRRLDAVPGNDVPDIRVFRRARDRFAGTRALSRPAAAAQDRHREAAASALRLVGLGLVLNLLRCRFISCRGSISSCITRSTAIWSVGCISRPLRCAGWKAAACVPFGDGIAGTFVVAGALVAFLLDGAAHQLLAAPLIGLAFMLHLFEALRTEASADIDPSSRSLRS